MTLFPQVLWVEAPSHAKCANNGPESFHARINEQLYAKLSYDVGTQTSTPIFFRGAKLAY
jgi:hypothetical protein